jgi:hypothetical protein
MRVLQSTVLGAMIACLCACWGVSDDSRRENEESRAAHELRQVDMGICFLLQDLAEAGQYPTNWTELEAAATDPEMKKRVITARTPEHGFGFLLIDTLTFKAEAVGNGGVRTRYEVGISKLEYAPAVTKLVMVREYPSSTEGGRDTVTFE